MNMQQLEREIKSKMTALYLMYRHHANDSVLPEECLHTLVKKTVKDSEEVYQIQYRINQDRNQ